MRHVHRHFKRIEELLYMYNITFFANDEYSSIEIIDLTLHAVTADGIADRNVFPENVEITTNIKLNVLKMLIADGLIAV